jgi:hypothetical protein
LALTADERKKFISVTEATTSQNHFGDSGETLLPYLQVFNSLGETPLPPFPEANADTVNHVIAICEQLADPAQKLHFLRYNDLQNFSKYENAVSWIWHTASDKTQWEKLRKQFPGTTTELIKLAFPSQTYEEHDITWEQMLEPQALSKKLAEGWLSDQDIVSLLTEISLRPVKYNRNDYNKYGASHNQPLPFLQLAAKGLSAKLKEKSVLFLSKLSQTQLAALRIERLALNHIQLQLQQYGNEHPELKDQLDALYHQLCAQLGESQKSLPADNLLVLFLKHLHATQERASDEGCKQNIQAITEDIRKLAPHARWPDELIKDLIGSLRPSAVQLDHWQKEGLYSYPCWSLLLDILFFGSAHPDAKDQITTLATTLRNTRGWTNQSENKLIGVLGCPTLTDAGQVELVQLVSPLRRYNALTILDHILAEDQRAITERCSQETSHADLLNRLLNTFHSGEAKKVILLELIKRLKKKKAEKEAQQERGHIELSTHNPEIYRLSITPRLVDTLLQHLPDVKVNEGKDRKEVILEILKILTTPYFEAFLSYLTNEELISMIEGKELFDSIAILSDPDSKSTKMRYLTHELLKRYRAGSINLEDTIHLLIEYKLWEGALPSAVSNNIVQSDFLNQLRSAEPQYDTARKGFITLCEIGLQNDKMSLLKPKLYKSICDVIDQACSAMNNATAIQCDMIEKALEKIKPILDSKQDTEMKKAAAGLRKHALETQSLPGHGQRSKRLWGAFLMLAGVVLGVASAAVMVTTCGLGALGFPPAGASIACGATLFYKYRNTGLAKAMLNVASAAKNSTKPTRPSALSKVYKGCNDYVNFCKNHTPAEIFWTPFRLFARLPIPNPFKMESTVRPRYKPV